MEQVKQANGYRLHSAARLLMPDISRTAQPKPREYAYDLEGTLDAVLSLRSEIPEDAFTASILGTEREGHGVLIGDDGLVLTIGYLIAEAAQVMLAAMNGKVAVARIVAYDYDSGFGLVRASEPLDVRPIPIGISRGVTVGDRMVVGGHGGTGQSLAAKVVSKREFAGYWEYLLDEAIFTAPPHPNWGGAALIGEDGKLAAIGSLFVQDAVTGEQAMRGNMFVPIDLLEPILPELLANGRTSKPSRPWLGMFTTEIEDHLVVAGLAHGGPAERADVRVGDIVLGVAGEGVHSLAEMLRRIWSLGGAGIEVRMTFQREDKLVEAVIDSANRYDFMKVSHLH